MCSIAVTNLPETVPNDDSRPKSILCKDGFPLDVLLPSSWPRDSRNDWVQSDYAKLVLLDDGGLRPASGRVKSTKLTK